MAYKNSQKVGLLPGGTFWGGTPLFRVQTATLVHLTGTEAKFDFIFS